MSLMMVYKFLHGCAPSYLGLFNYVADLPSRRGLRSSCSVHPPVHCWRSSIFGCWPPGVELPVTEGYVGAMSDSLLHSTPFRNDSSAHIRLNLTFLRLHTVHNGPIAVLQMLRSLKKFMIDRVDATGVSTCRYRLGLVSLSSAFVLTASLRYCWRCSISFDGNITEYCHSYRCYYLKPNKLVKVNYSKSGNCIFLIEYWFSGGSRNC